MIYPWVVMESNIVTNKLLITSALPYVSGDKHLGNIAGSMLPADIAARYHRQRGLVDVVFICATDEHGTPAELSALKAGLPPDEFCAREHLAQAEIYRRFGFSFDYFGRTSSQANHDLTQEIFLELDRHGFIDERETSGIWSPADNRWLPDRYVVGTCPHCAYPHARGDQCDGCNRLLEPTQLLCARSAISGIGNLEVRAQKHLFLRQSLLAKRLRSWVEDKNDWEPLARSIALKWLDTGLEDRCITRDLDWGIRIPRKGYEHLVFYVWFDAPIGYLATLKEWADSNGKDWQDWIRTGNSTRWIQVMGKDNVPFHALTFPATLLGSALDIRLVDHIKGLNWLTWGRDKFSTSQGKGLSAQSALDEFPADLWRWWLAANAPEGSDTEFSWSLFASTVNSDLADNLGNLVSRVGKFVESRYGGIVPCQGQPGPQEMELHGQAELLVAQCSQHLEAIHLRKACSSIRALWTLANVYVANQQPWSVIKSDPDKAACITRTAVNLLAIIAQVSFSLIPQTSAVLLTSLNRNTKPSWPDCLDEFARPGGQHIIPTKILFPKISLQQVVLLEEKYC